MTPFSSILYLPAVSFIFILTDSNIESSIHTIWQCQLAKGSAQLCKLQEERRCNLTQRWWRSRRCSYVESSLCFLGLVFNGYPCPVYCQYYWLHFDQIVVQKHIYGEHFDFCISSPRTCSPTSPTRWGWRSLSPSSPWLASAKGQSAPRLTSTTCVSSQNKYKSKVV